MPLKQTIKIIVISFCVSCGSQSVNQEKSIEVTFPDTSRSWVGRMTSQDYKFTRVLEEKFQLSDLKNGSKNTEVRVWKLSGAYDPQSLSILQGSSGGQWNLRVIEFYHEKSDSIGKEYFWSIKASFLDTLNLDRYWSMTSQSDLREGDKYGCMDGNSILIELADARKYRLKWYRCPEVNISKDRAFSLTSELIARLDTSFGIN